MDRGLRFEAVRFGWEGEAPLLDGFDLTLDAGAVTAIVGPSGSGKSTLLRLAAGLARPSGGRVSGGEGERAFVFQAPTLLAWRTVAENVGLPLELRGVRPADRRGPVAEALRAVGLAADGDRLPHALSGGMQMRASLARALVLRPGLLLLDEPFAALDAITRVGIREAFEAAWTAAEATVLLVTHDLDEAVLLADRVVVVGGRPLRVFDSFAVPLPRPRGRALRYDPRLERLVAAVEAALP